MSLPFDDYPFGTENDLRPVWDVDPFDNFWGDLNDFLEPPSIPDVSQLVYPGPNLLKDAQVIAQSFETDKTSVRVKGEKNEIEKEQSKEVQTKEEKLEGLPIDPYEQEVFFGDPGFWLPPVSESTLEIESLPDPSCAVRGSDLDVTMTDAFSSRASQKIGKEEKPAHPRVQHEIFHQYYPDVAYYHKIESHPMPLPQPVFEVKSEDKQLKRRLELENECFLFETDPNGMDALHGPTLLEEDDPTGGFKLPASKSPIMEAMVVCALNGWGIELVQNTNHENGAPPEIVFRVLDFDRYYRISRAICSKQRPTDDVGSRVKSLRRWFVNFPKKKVRCEKGEFMLTVKPQIAGKVGEIVERNTRMLGVSKRRRKQ